MSGRFHPVPRLDPRTGRRQATMPRKVQKTAHRLAASIGAALAELEAMQADLDPTMFQPGSDFQAKAIALRAEMRALDAIVSKYVPGEISERLSLGLASLERILALMPAGARAEV